MMYRYEDLRVVHLEITSKCQAACPLCQRNVNGGPTNPLLPLTELSLAELQDILPEDFVKQLDFLFMCGNFGDPIIASDTLAVFRWLRSVNPNIGFGMNTNGSGRSPEWWAELAGLFTTGTVKFGIDGLADTHHLYRRNTSFEKIIKNASAFISAGGQAEWDFLVFKHNEHQIVEARELAMSLGFSKFNLKRTSRFYDSAKGGEVVDKIYVQGEYLIEMPENPAYRNAALAEVEQLNLDTCGIACKVSKIKSIYISAEGYVFPCCWTAAQLYPLHLRNHPEQLHQTPMWKLFDQHRHEQTGSTLKAIVEGKFFSAIVESWSKPSIAEGRLRVCAKICGSVDVQGRQFS